MERDGKLPVVSWDGEYDRQCVANTIQSVSDRPIILLGHSKGGEAIMCAGDASRVQHLICLAADIPGSTYPRIFQAHLPRFEKYV
jgi:hypothetical protein